MRVPLLDAPPDVRLVESLIPMWDEETATCAAQGCSLPRAPDSPTRKPTVLCPAVDAVRAQLQTLAAMGGDRGRVDHGQPPPSPHARLLRESPAANNVAATPLPPIEHRGATLPPLFDEQVDVFVTPQQGAQEAMVVSQADEALLHVSQTTDDDALLHALAQAAASQPPMSR